MNRLTRLNPLSLLLSSKTTTKGRVSNNKRPYWAWFQFNFVKELKKCRISGRSSQCAKWISLFLMLFHLFDTTKFNLIEISTRTLTWLNLEEKNIVLSFNSLQFKNLSWVEFCLSSIQLKLHLTNSFNIFIQMELDFYKINSFFSLIHFHW